MTRLVRGLVLLCLSALIAKLLITGQMALYLSPSLNPLTGAGGLVLAAMAAFEIRSVWLRRSENTSHQSLIDQALTAVLVLLPVGLGLIVVPRALDPSALGSQDVTRLVVTFSPVGTLGEVTAPAHPIQDLPDLFQYLRTAGEDAVGQPVHLVGMLVRNSDQPADEFVLLRYSIVHCVADAQPIGLLLQVPRELAATYGDAWVELDGVLATRERDGAHLVAVLVSRLGPTDEPATPYLQGV